MVLQLLCNLLQMECWKKKYNLYFDFGEEKNNELLKDKNKQEKFHNKLRKALSNEYNIKENEIIITLPKKGSYNIQVIFQSHEFNDLNLKSFKQKFKNDDELCYIKDIFETLIMEGCKLNKNMLDYKGNRVDGWGIGEKRGGYDYFPPLNGWKGFGLNVSGRYDNSNDDWLAHEGNKNEWAVAYHGIRTKKCDKNGKNYTLEGALKSILYEGLNKGGAQAYKTSEDLNNKGNEVGEGVYCRPYPDVLEEYANYSTSTTEINGKKYMIGLMMRIKPDKIRIPIDKKEYWVLNGTDKEIRPYRILIKEKN